MTQASECQHDWTEVESIFSNEYVTEGRCSICHEMGEMDNITGEITLIHV